MQTADVMKMKNVHVIFLIVQIWISSQFAVNGE